MCRSILLVSHGKLATAMKKSVELIAGEQRHLYALPMGEQSSLDSYSEELEKTVLQLIKRYDELFILADIRGGTPCNAATSILLKDNRIKLIAGFNLSLVIESCITTLSPTELIENTTDNVLYVNEAIKI